MIGHIHTHTSRKPAVVLSNPAAYQLRTTMHDTIVYIYTRCVICMWYVAHSSDGIANFLQVTTYRVTRQGTGYSKRRVGREEGGRAIQFAHTYLDIVLL